MVDESNTFIAYSTETITFDGVEFKRFECNLCDFLNAQNGGMKCHVAANQKSTGTKRPLT